VFALLRGFFSNLGGSAPITPDLLTFLSTHIELSQPSVDRT
jgi:hypothetical protein